MALSFNSEQINEVARKAGKLLEKLSLDPEMRKPMNKPDGSPVTPSDYLLSEQLVEELSPLGFQVISEEALPKTPPGLKDSYFLIDPLDGTKYFSRGEDEYAICIGLIKEGEPVYGAIYDPIDSMLYWAEKGGGAFMDDQKIAHPGPGDGLIVYSSGFHKKPERDKIINRLGITEIREKGSALKFCDLAAGRVDLYMRFGPTSEWDTAAAQVILEEAGCFLFEAFTQQTMTYGKPKYLNRGILAGHTSVQDPVVALVKEEFQKNNRYK